MIVGSWISFRLYGSREIVRNSPSFYTRGEQLTARKEFLCDSPRQGKKFLKVFLLRDHLQSLENEVTKRFQKFKKAESKFYLLCYPITADMDAAPEELQNELVTGHYHVFPINPLGESLGPALS
ncbi:hypothetical protein TNCV_712641 [Trichonephila clavipes]|nr:hypothetical protein TNCV_712641 [Trichonephila clavipes]